jgi:ribulose-phosphate 3-epimerase
MTQIVPAILVRDAKTFEAQLRSVKSECSLVQVDALDGTLFPNTNWFDAQSIGKLETEVEIELHLMVENPIPIIEEWKKYVPTFKRAIVHAEMHRPIGVITAYIKDVMKLEVGVAINPETPLSAIEGVIHSIDQVTIMSVHPGAQGQSFGDDEHVTGTDFIFEKIRQIKAHRPDLTIEIDGGLTRDLIPSLVQAGVNNLCAGSLLFKSDDPTLTLRKLNETLNI